MKFHLLLPLSLIAAGCTGSHPKGVSRFDRYDAAKVDQMVGNNVSSAVLERTVVCLNARRESRHITSVTNVQLLTITNAFVVAATNQVVSLSTNFLATTMTNLAPPSPAVTPAPAGEGEAAGPREGNPLIVVTNPPAAITTNVSLSLASNQSSTTSPTQTAANQQHVRTLNQQFTIASNTLTISLMTNLVITGETNQTVNYSTNYSIASVTNLLVSPTNLVLREYYLYTELTPPPDFTAATGDNLILLVDGVRHSFAPVPPTAAFASRKGYTSSLYRVPPEVLVEIANARNVELRLRGTTMVIDRTMSRRSRENFKKFMLKYFQPEPTSGAGQATMAVAEPVPHAVAASAVSN